MVVDGSRGSTTLIVWAHHILGLPVLVVGAPKGDIPFGSGEPSVIIYIKDISL